ncbi:hypothetical protein SFC17_05205 [Bacillus paralicheniformis]|jgi:hypothetical protein|uniref:hypothetical protein n=1 Tax=Bacillus paralicheniformis TaxID=1648923 RepID=UPI001D38733D|nr:hypothetical protein [Bacillus paralicheniformis]MBZ5213849.1 hypothetical protein [Bacillus paralicheniformis]WMW49396.1 hypothetical protein RFN66_10890 [Bacillus paralicheniformis]
MVPVDLLDWLVDDVVFDTVLFPNRALTFFLNAARWLESLTDGAGQDRHGFNE